LAPKRLSLYSYFCCFTIIACRESLVEEKPILWIVLGVIIGIVLIGLLLLIIWKIVVTGYVRRIQFL